MDYSYVIVDHGAFTTPEKAETYKRECYLLNIDCGDYIMLPIDPIKQLKVMTDLIWNIIEKRLVHGEVRPLDISVVDKPLEIQLGQQVPNLFHYIVSGDLENGKSTMNRFFKGMKFILIGEFAERIS